MFKRHWIIAATLGLAILLGLWQTYEVFSAYQQDHANERIATAQNQITAAQQSSQGCRSLVDEASFVDWITCLVEQSSTEPNAKQAEYDLKAQQDMAAWAFGMLLVTIWLTVITLVGVFFIGWTLFATRQMVIDTREIGKAQVRAYPYIQSIWVGTANEENFRVTFTVSNKGNSVARNAVVKCSAAACIDEEGTVIQTRDSAEITAYLPSVLGDSAETLSQGLTPSVSKHLFGRREPGSRFSVRFTGSIYYEDIFENSFELPFDLAVNARPVTGNRWEFDLDPMHGVDLKVEAES